MGWIRIDDHFDEHPKLAKVGPIAWGLWLAGLAYCNRNLTDGFIPWAVAQKLASFKVVDNTGRLWTLARTCGMVGDDIDADWVIGLLVDAGLWEEVEGGFQVHDYLDYQPSRERVLREREQARRRMAAARAAKDGSRSGEVQANFVGTSDDVRETFNGSSDNPNPNPNPNPKEKTRTMSPNGDISAETAEGSLFPASGGEEKESVERKKRGSLASDVERVMAYFNERFVPGVFSRPLRLTKERARHIRARLEHYSVDDLCKAIDHLRQSPFHCGENDRGQVYATPEFLFRNDTQVDKWLNHPPIGRRPGSGCEEVELVYGDEEVS